jgi:transposase InsO family protein
MRRPTSSFGDEGDDVGPHFRLAQAVSGVRVLRLHEQCEDVAGHAPEILGKPGSSGGNDGVDRCIEETQRRLNPPAREPRHEIWQPQHIERIDTPDRVEIRPHRGAHVCWLRAEAIRKDGALEDVECGLRNLRRDVQYPTVGVAPPSADQSVGGILHRWDEAHHASLGEEWGKRAKYMARRRRPPSQGWKTFLRSHADGIASMDLFVVPTISFRLLYGFLILRHSRREILWLGVTAHPSAQWFARQLSEAYGWQQAPQYIVRDRDCVYGDVFIRRLRAMGIRDRPIAPRSPWQNGYAERLIGSIRRDCLDHVVVFGERHLRHLLGSYQRYYNDARTHLSLNKDAPASRAVQAVGRVVANPHFGGLHHQYVRI